MKGFDEPRLRTMLRSGSRLTDTEICELTYMTGEPTLTTNSVMAQSLIMRELVRSLHDIRDGIRR